MFSFPGSLPDDVLGIQLDLCSSEALPSAQCAACGSADRGQPMDLVSGALAEAPARAGRLCGAAAKGHGHPGIQMAVGQKCIAISVPW